MKNFNVSPLRAVFPILLLAIIAVMWTCNKLTVNNAEVNDLKWLEGKWKGNQNGTKVKTTWKQLSSQSINGTTYLLNNQDTTGIRALRIESTNGSIILNLRRSAEKPPVGYKLSKINKNHAVFSNPEARFPNSIEFKKKGEKLTALWSGKNKGKETSNKYVYSPVE